MSNQRPVVGTIIGDPCGIGPEIVLKSWSAGKVHKCSLPFLIGSVEVVRKISQSMNLGLQIRKITAVHALSDSPDIVDVFDTGLLDPDAVRTGETTVACGAACGAWLAQARDMYDAGKIQAITLAPIDTSAMKAAGVLHELVPENPGQIYLMLLSGTLKVAHVTDHIPLRRVCDLLSVEMVEAALIVLHEALVKWGIPKPRIGVAGLNPHAMGEEDSKQIKPAIENAQSSGIDAKGPISPDTVFRHCIEGHFDAVLAMYHDQGHIAVKTASFSGNCVVELGSPRLLLSVGHGVAYDIAGRGAADFRMMESAMVTAGSLASGMGFRM